MKGGLSFVVTLLVIIIMVIFGGMFLGALAADVSNEDISGTPFEGVADMVGSLYAVFQSALPVFVWLLVIAVIAGSLFMLFKFRK